MDRYYTMRPINLAGEVTGYRAELVGVGAGADALRTIMQTAIQRVGVSITPVVCQQLFIEVLNAAVDFACDSGTSVNLADTISFKWNTRGKYDRIDATVPKSALSLTAIVSPKITRNATPRFDLKAMPVEPTLTKVDNPLDTTKRGIVARGLSLTNVAILRVVDATTRQVYVSYLRGTSFEVSDDGRALSLTGDGALVNVIPENASVQLEYATWTAPEVFVAFGPIVAALPRVTGMTIITATPQPLDINNFTFFNIVGEGFADFNGIVEFASFNGDVLLTAEAEAETDKTITLTSVDIQKVAGWAGGAVKMTIMTVNRDVLASFNVALAAYSL